MDRREMLKMGALAGVGSLASVSGSSCAIFPGGDQMGNLNVLNLPEMDSYLATINQGMDKISEWDLAREYGISDPAFERRCELGRKALRSMYMVGMFGDLSVEGQAHPGMQDRMVQALPEMDEAILTTTDDLEKMTAGERTELQKVLQDNKDPGMMIAQELDEGAGMIHLSRKRRLQTRAIISQANWRLRNQPPDLLINECVAKVRKMAERRGSPAALQRQAAAQLSKKAFFERQGRLAAAAEMWEAKATRPGKTAPEQDRIIRPPGSGAISAGGWMMGIGLVSGCAGMLIASFSIGGLFAVTLGVLLLVIGLITLIVGAIIGKVAKR